MTRTRVKVCCISSRDEAAAAIRAGANALGLVGAMPSGPGVIDDDRIADIASRVPPGVDTFLLTARTEAGAILDHHRACRTTTLQLVDHVQASERERLRREIPGVRIVQVVHVSGPESVAEALEAAEHTHAVLLDSGNPSLPVKELGGTGRPHDWDISRRIVEALDLPVFLAGGLNPGNIAKAVARVRPYGIDVCSGVRSPVGCADGLDADKLSALIAAIPA
ncbi:MAG: N-(5'-phosphoribosyl)anthranilate isomerase [Phycisphaeraceae bacterium]|nr:MAG: N-(5'-phosphoribosyl)anthranilate isomerase [Phycisphaeraceae bacterium]